MDKLQMLRDNIRILRQAYGESQEQLGKALGNMKKSTVSSDITGDIVSVLAWSYTSDNVVDCVVFINVRCD